MRFTSKGQTAALVPIMTVKSCFTGRRGVCLPFSDFCAPLFFEEAGRCADRILDALAALVGKNSWKYLEIRGPMAKDDPLATEEFYSHRLDLSRGYAPVAAGFTGSVRRALRKAERSGLEASVSHSEESVMEFFRLHERTRRRHGVPPQPVAFFRAIRKHLIGPGKGLVSMVRTGEKSAPASSGKLIAASIFLRWGSRALYKFGASDERFWSLRPNNLCMSHGVEILARDGANSLDLGRTALDHQGLRRFKLGWGAAEELTHYHRIGLEQARSGGGAPSRLKRIAEGMIGSFPLAWNRLAGRLIYPHID